MSEAISLAHVGRPLALASVLDQHQYEIHFAVGNDFSEFLSGYPFIRHTITTLSHATFQERIRRGESLWDKELLALQVKEDLALISQIQPDLIVSDFRLSLGVSARVANIPYALIANAHWNPLTLAKYPVPDITCLRFLPLPLAQLFFDVVSPRGFTWHVSSHNALRKMYGLSLLPKMIASIYTDADYVLYADLPELFPNDALLPHHTFIGPVLWSPHVDTTQLLAHIPTDKPLLYFGLGTSGNNELLPKIFASLSTLPVTIIASTAGKKVPAYIPPHVFTVPYAHGETIAGKVDLVISNGGTGTTYQALAAGKPLIGIASNLDQLLAMERVVNAGAGLLLRATRLRPKELSTAVMKILNDPAFKKNAMTLQERFSAHQSDFNFAQIVAELCRSPQKPSRNEIIRD